jgi:D-alanyl-D-alanine carboxypeptidase
VSYRIIAVLIAVAVQTTPLHAQAAPADTVDRFIAAEMSRQHIPGVALAVVRAGKVIKAQGYGMADLEHGIPVTTETVFKIGSVSKQFLATGIMLLAQDGRLSVDDPIDKYFPGTPESWRGITVRHFLTHTSGVLREGPAFDAWKVQPDSAVIKSAFERPLEFPMGSKYQYCNVCYFTLAEIIARVSGKPWDVFLAERVFRPMGMTATRTTTTTDLVRNRARGYAWRDSRYVNAPEYRALRPSGAFLSTVLDLAKWDAALYEDRVLTKSSRTAMWAPVRLTDGATYGYGFGWQLDSLDGRWRVFHGGSLPGFRAQMMRFPNDSLTVIVLTNADGANPVVIARDVARIYLTKANASPAPGPAPQRPWRGPAPHPRRPAHLGPTAYLTCSAADAGC